MFLGAHTKIMAGDGCVCLWNELAWIQYRYDKVFIHRMPEKNGVCFFVDEEERHCLRNILIGDLDIL